MKTIIKKDTTAYDEFIVNDVDGNRVTGLGNGDFTKYLYNPSGNEVSSSVMVTIAELGQGVYRANFTPNAIGNWCLAIIQATHFPFGKVANYECTISTLVDLNRLLGLSQENYRVVDPVYVSYGGNDQLTSGTIKIYKDATDCENDTNSIASYSIVATYNSSGNMTSYKVKKNA